ncbi:hypothetical protein [Leptothoe sp. PORK10 BA2]|uniref:hypothetical protein n=1 Tax=Leptothoe sp. PORK10 BA2 TaxID=3110254 RepID=UPI003FA3B1D3
MLVILLDNHVIPSATVCASCLMANQSGQPRFHDGKLGCAQPLDSSTPLPHYQCQMGFRLANIESWPAS